MPARGAAPGADFEQALADADAHANAGRHADALRTYAAAFEAMPDSLRVGGVAEFAVLAAARAAIADYQDRGEVQALERARAVLVQFIEDVTAEPNAEVSATAAEQLLAEIEALVPADHSPVGEHEVNVEPSRPLDPKSASAPAEQEDPGNLRGMGKAGIGLLVVGGSIAIGGAVLAAREPTGFPDRHPNANKISSTRPPGWAMLGGGAAFIVVGAVLLGIDRKRAKPRQASAARSVAPGFEVRASIHPWLGIDGGGLGATGRF
ncbi:MAG: hypothetical protein AAGF11_42575 [Myxococcota bacterium]